MTEPFRLLGRRFLARSSMLTLEQRHYLSPGGVHQVRAVVRHPGAVAVVPLIDEEVVLIRQFRAPVAGPLWEIPAGKLDLAGEEAAATARRECEEEVGYRPGSLELLTSILTTPGFSDERIDIFLAEGLEPVTARPEGIEEELAEVRRIPFDEALRMIDQGEIVDAKTQIGLLALARRRNTT